ncbi:MAG: type II secretion system protein GspC [Desulfobacterales bacterium]
MIRYYFVLANCILIILAAYLGVGTAYRIATAKLQVSLPVAAPLDRQQKEPQSVQQPLTYYTEIAGRNLLNVTSKKNEIEKEVDLGALEKTELQLKLWGTVTGKTEKAYAVIEDTNIRTQNLYREGDTVQGADIKLILREKVVLTRDEVDEVLEMEKSQQGPPQIRTAAARPISRHRLLSPGTQSITLDRSQIDEAMQNINNLMQQVRIMPHFENGQPNGFSLTGIRPNSIVRKMGLRNGDIITGVNGKNIETMEDAMGFYQQLSSGDTVSLDMKRRGRERTIEYKIR